MIPDSETLKTLPALDAVAGGRAPEVLALLRGRRLGLLTNHTGCTQNGKPALDVLQELDCNVRALFSPEHGFSGSREGKIASGRTSAGLPVYSLYGDTRRPTQEMLAGIEVLVCDLQDVGARFYTYSTTLAYCLEECAAHKIAVVVLDRPNPLGGKTIEGPGIDNECRSFVGYLRVPVRHGLTLGELALLHRADENLDMELHIAPVLNWKGSMHWPDTKLTWPVPSPNLPDYESAAWYPGLCLLEFSGVSVGRGTDAPFQIIGSPWLDAGRVLDALQAVPLFRENFRATAIEFTPSRGEYSGTACRGLRFTTHHSSLITHHFVVPLGFTLLSTLHQTHPHEFDEAKLCASLPLLGSSKVLDLLRDGNIAAAQEMVEQDAAAFRTRRASFLIYS